MSRIRPWTNGDQVALSALGEVPVVQADKTVLLYDSAGVALVFDGSGNVPVVVDSTVPVNITGDVGLQDGAGVDLESDVNVDRSVNLDGTNGLNVNGIMYARVSDTAIKPARLDAVTEAIMTVSYAHHETHAGSHFNYRDSYALAKNAVQEHLIITPNTTSWAHMIFGVAASGGQVDVEIFEGTITSANGSVEPVMNRNRNSLNANTTLLYDSPTVTSDGTRISKQTFGVDDKKSAGGGSRDSEEIMLKQNTKYLFRVTEMNVADAVINFDFDWYEHTDRN